MKKIVITILLFSGFILNGAIINPRIHYVEWEQLSNDLKFNVALEKEEFSNLDREARIVFAAEKGKAIKSLDEISIKCRISSMETSSAIFEKEMPAEKGIIVFDFELEDLSPGNYKVSGEVKHAGKILKTEEKIFRYVKEDPPANRGKIPLFFSAGVPLKEPFPVSFGIPFPKGALWDEKNVRIVDRKGNEIPCQKTVRSRWGYSSKSSIRWLGIDFQPQELKPDWMNKTQTNYFVEFGPQIKPASFSGIKIEETPEFYNVDTGKAKFVIRKKAWNLIDSVSLKGNEVFKNSPDQGFYLIDHQGGIYRACNDREVKVEIEEKGPLKTVFRVEGWYVKDDTEGNTISYRLPTDKLCKFITRIEVYSGKPYVRILHTIVFTFDSYAVRLKDIALSLFSSAGKNIFFGIENESPFKTDLQKDGSVYLIQHLPDRFSIESSDGKIIREGKHSQGWFALEKMDNTIIGINHRETWQRFPKEFEVTSDSIKLHIWPLHGKNHPEINEIEPQEIYKLWFAHRGKELNLAMPWKYFFKAAEMYNGPQTGVYTAPGLVLAGIHSSILGAALTSDILISFSDKNEGIEKQKELSDCFQVLPHCLPDPQWTCDSLAVGYISPYSPDRFKQIEDCIEKLVKGYRELQDYTGQYGMWIYRTWHHTSYKGDRTFDLYRFFNATHHYEAFMPWLLYVRSGDPFYLEQARANTRLFSDLNIIHYDDASCERRELHFNQKNITGSTRHTNGFCPWGGDHALLGHLTCYNALMLAHYLTGDLRLKEIITDEWQKTIVSDRKNPEFQGAVRLEPGRDNNNALGELIDLYQMTYNPALLVYIDDCLKKFLTNMYHWGQPLHNVLLFYKSQQAKRQLMDGMADPKSDKLNLWYTHSSHENYALAAIYETDRNKQIEYASKAFFSSDIYAWSSKADRLKNKESFGAFCAVSDFVLYMPRVILALSKANVEDPTQGSYSQSLPGCPGATYCIVKEEKDRDFNIFIRGEIGKKESGGFPMVVMDPDKKTILEVVVDKPYSKFTIPKDGKTGEYVITLAMRDGKDDLYAPLTDLEKEVYYVNYWFQCTETRFFTRPTTDTGETIGIQPHVSSAYIISNKTNQLIASTEKGEKIEIEMPPEGVWINSKARYMHLKQPLILSNDENHWFLPESIKGLEFKVKWKW